ncbi:MAG: AI-2E family transporter [Rhodospirillaceae bacterium]|jgi:putative permease|nr:AI-2E family transporter [Rhodospirillaceae bacterium]
MDLIRNWFKTVSDNPQLTLLMALLIFTTAALALTADILAPFLAAVVLAYLLQVFIDRLERYGVSPWLSITLVFVVFVLLTLAIVFGLIPLLIRQMTQLTRQAPEFIANLQETVSRLPEQYPALITPAQADQVMNQLQTEVLDFSQAFVGSLGGTVVGLMTWVVYLIIVPLMVFFLIKDKTKIVAWTASFLPRERELAGQVWLEVHRQLQNYVGGKALEIFIVAVISYVTFIFIDLQYALLLAVTTGFSVLIPYIGAAVVTLPVAVVAILQWGFTSDAGVALAAYGIIQALDGNVLVPFVFSEVVDIHPVAIIVAILFFGGIWGFWGVFFAIPLAVVVQAVLGAWPRSIDAGSPEPGSNPTG